MCSRSSECALALNSPNSVFYGVVRHNQMLVLDRSFSMHYPEPVENSKIEAARNAARLYVDAANDLDQIGLVTFNGNGGGCDDDAQLVRDMVQVAPNRDDMVNAINAVVEDGWTSIGDGLKRGRDRLLAATTGPDDENAIVLLSDGWENEGDYWAQSDPACSPASPPVRNSFASGGPANGIRVDTVAFGPAANQELLQDIATWTAGIFYAVNSDAPAGSGLHIAAAAAPMALASFERPDHVEPGSAESTGACLPEHRGGHPPSGSPLFPI